MGIWKNLFGIGAENNGYVLGDVENNAERLFGYDGSSQAIRYVDGNVYTPAGERLGNYMPSVRDTTPSMPEPPKSSLQAFNSPLTLRLREFTERKLREG
ncbi:MAG: hypothetical protein M3N49_00430 [Candidatus Eremiobacteraeota bacterium]|nr:hypothetical protein [Candidatus Eremiobacteraeota bacterium]